MCWGSQTERNRELAHSHPLWQAIILSRSRGSNPLVHHGWHFGRTVHAMCNIWVLIVNSLLLLEDGEVTKESLTTTCVSWPLYNWRLVCCSNVGKERSTRYFSNCCRPSPICQSPSQRRLRKIALWLRIWYVHLSNWLSIVSSSTKRFKKVYQVQGPMIRRV